MKQKEIFDVVSHDNASARCSTSKHHVIGCINESEITCCDRIVSCPDEQLDYVDVDVAIE